MFVLMLALLVGSAVGLGARGTGARSIARAGIISVEDSSELLATTDRLRAHGVVMLGCTADLGYSPVNMEMSAADLRWPVAQVDLENLYRSGVDRDSWAWVLAKSGVARRIDYLMPEKEFVRRVAEGRAQGFPGIAADGRSIRANDEGYVRLIAPDLRGAGTPLLVVVDASYFVTGTEAELLEELGQLAVAPEVIVLNHAADDPDVTAEARAALTSAKPELSRLATQ